MKQTTLVALFGLLGLSACYPLEAEFEVENPRSFYVIAEYEGPYGHSIFEEYGARLRCQRFEGFSENDGPYAEECDGAYVLETSGGLSLGFRDERFLARGAQPTTRNGGLAVLFENKLGEGEAHISKSDQLQHGFGTVFSRDIAGGFEVTAGEHRFLRGFFYSIAPGSETL